MKKTALDSVVKDLLSIAPLIRRSIQRKLVRTAFVEKEADITLPHLEIMKILHEEGIKHIAEIGQTLLIPKPQMTRLIDRLEELKIIVRKVDNTDRRANNIKLTEKGKRMVDELDCVMKDTVKMKLSCLTEEELMELSVSLKKLNDILYKI